MWHYNQLFKSSHWSNGGMYTSLSALQLIGWKQRSSHVWKEFFHVRAALTLFSVWSTFSLHLMCVCHDESRVFQKLAIFFCSNLNMKMNICQSSLCCLEVCLDHFDNIAIFRVKPQFVKSWPPKTNWPIAAYQTCRLETLLWRLYSFCARSRRSS